MTGKGDFVNYKDFGKEKGKSITLNRTIDLNEIELDSKQHSKLYIEQYVNDLKQKLTKYKRAFEILKNVSIIVVDKNFIQITTNAIWRNDNSEPNELLEELMKSETSI